MKSIFRKISLLAVFVFGVIGAAQAAPVTYDFTATGFTAAQGHSVPNSSLAGSITIDGTTVTDIDLTIGSHTYTASEVGYLSNWLGGGTACSVNCIAWGTNDFWITGNFSSTPTFHNFFYSVAGVVDIFSTYTGTLTVDVPEPATLAMFGLGLLAFGFARRRKV